VIQKVLNHNDPLKLKLRYTNCYICTNCWKKNKIFKKSAKHTSVTNSIRSIYSTNAPTHIHTLYKKGLLTQTVARNSAPWWIVIQHRQSAEPLSYSAPPLPIFPLEFRGEVTRQETRVMGLLCGEGCVILTVTVFDWSTRVTDSGTDRQTDRRMGYGI